MVGFTPKTPAQPLRVHDFDAMMHFLRRQLAATDQAVRAASAADHQTDHPAVDLEAGAAHPVNPSSASGAAGGAGAESGFRFDGVRLQMLKIEGRIERKRNLRLAEARPAFGPQGGGSSSGARRVTSKWTRVRSVATRPPAPTPGSMDSGSFSEAPGDLLGTPTPPPPSLPPPTSGQPSQPSPPPPAAARAQVPALARPRARTFDSLGSFMTDRPPHSHDHHHVEFSEPPGPGSRGGGSQQRGGSGSAGGGGGGVDGAGHVGGRSAWRVARALAPTLEEMLEVEQAAAQEAELLVLAGEAGSAEAAQAADLAAKVDVRAQGAAFLVVVRPDAPDLSKALYRIRNATGHHTLCFRQADCEE